MEITSPSRKRPHPSSSTHSAEEGTEAVEGGPPGTDKQDFIPPNSALQSLDRAAALAYWGAVTPDDAGVLGGYPHVSRADLQGSLNFLRKLRRGSKVYGARNHNGSDEASRFERVVDCGAGIGRVTVGCLAKVAKVVDVVEPVVRLTDVITKGEGFRELREEGRIGRVWNVGIEAWTPEETYDVIWTQWCCGQLTDVQLVEYFVRCVGHLREGGWLVVKENMSTDLEGRDIFDGTDNSVTRTDRKFRELFKEAGLKIVLQEVQTGMPREIYPVKSYALQAEVKK